MSSENAALKHLMDQFTQYVRYHHELITTAPEKVDQLKDDLEFLNAVLIYSSNKVIKDERERVLVRQIREAMYNCEEVMDAFITLAEEATTKSKNILWRCCYNVSRLDNIAQNAQNVMKEVKRIYGDTTKADFLSIEFANDDDQGLTEPEVPLAKKEKTVGLDDQAEEIIGYLKEKTERLDVITIVGLAGQGKSLLARKICQDPSIEKIFTKRLWVSVSKFSPKEVFLKILRQLVPEVTEEMRSMEQNDLATKVRGLLETGNFLIVLDNIWEENDWKNVSVALPETNFENKILVTSRSVEVAKSINEKRMPHSMRRLTPNESWELLQYVVFGQEKCESKLEVYGRIIAQKCKHSPIGILALGGILKKKNRMADPIERTDLWRSFVDQVDDYFVDDPDGKMEKVISASYSYLPYHLKPCFLYLSMFPKQFNIPTWKLFRMWIAEGFIQEKKGLTLEQTAESYLDELISRNLVEVDDRNLKGKVKTCHIHDLYSGFCRKQAGKERENFLQEITRVSGRNFEPSLSRDNYHRRLCIHSHFSDFVSLKPSGHHVRSFVCISEVNVTLQENHISAIPSGFKRLRVLDVKPFKFPRIPSKMYDLLYLRYIHLSLHLPVLPTEFSKLSNLETLIVDTTESTLEIKANIWKMRHLRHVKTNKTSSLPIPSEADSRNTSDIQTLSTISPENCTARFFSTARNLKKVAVRGNLDMLVNGETTGVSFDKMVTLGKLEKLKLQNDLSELLALPSVQRFPPNLRILTLSATKLKWSRINELASLQTLEVLKLKKNACVGNHWEVYGEFRHLQILFIGFTNLIVWTMLARDFPNLEHLELQDCELLQEVPETFADIPSLKKLVLKNCQTAAASARIIEQKKSIKAERDKTIKFNLSIL